MNQATSKYNAEFAKIKRKIFDRDKWKCQSGLLTHDLHLTVDHIVKRSLRGKNTSDNLITLCDRCHSIFDTMNNYQKVRILREKLEKMYGYTYESYPQIGHNE